MAAIGFYHLTRSAPVKALPPLLGRTLAAGERAVVVCDSDERLIALDAALWLSTDPAWLPHGSEASGDAELQPIWLSRTADAPNGARFLFMIDGAGAPSFDKFVRVFDLFAGDSDVSVAAARARWTDAQSAGHALTYWQQTPNGWDQRR